VWHRHTLSILKYRLFRSNNISVIDECRLFFNFVLPSEKIEKRRIGFESKFSNCISFCTTLTYVRDYANIVAMQYLYLVKLL